MAFTAPVSNTEGVKVADLNGHLLIVTPIEYKTGINTVNGVAEAIEVHVVELDTNEEHHTAGDNSEQVVIHGPLPSKTHRPPWLLATPQMSAAGANTSRRPVVNGDCHRTGQQFMQVRLCVLHGDFQFIR